MELDRFWGQHLSGWPGSPKIGCPREFQMYVFVLQEGGNSGSIHWPSSCQPNSRWLLLLMFSLVNKHFKKVRSDSAFHFFSLYPVLSPWFIQSYSYSAPYLPDLCSQGTRRAFKCPFEACSAPRATWHFVDSCHTTWVSVEKPWEPIGIVWEGPSDFCTELLSMLNTVLCCVPGSPDRV